MIQNPYSTFLVLCCYGVILSSKGYFLGPKRGGGGGIPKLSSARLFAKKATAASSSLDVIALEQDIDAALASGCDPIPYIEKLESCMRIKEPNRLSAFLGEWHVWWTDCPPPSNGQLGPFRGTSGQVIQDTSTCSYQNLLKVPPNDWLMATLDGVYQDWDGVLLTDETGSLPSNSNNNRSMKSKTNDWGADHWKVTFVRMTFSLFGWNFFGFDFPTNTSRIWRTTYLSDAVRIVRAGRTGLPDSESIFYTKREPSPLPLLRESFGGPPIMDGNCSKQSQTK